MSGKHTRIDDRALAEQLDQQAKVMDHGRTQKILDTVNHVVCWAIYSVFFIVVGGLIIVAGYWLYQKNWSPIVTNVKALALIFGGYLISQLERIGIRRKV